MDLVAVETRHVADRMDACIPVVKIKGRICCVAFEAYERLRPGRKIFDIYKGLVIARGLLSLLCVRRNLLRSDPLNSEASGPMA